MRVAITGADGFLGSHLARRFLKGGWQVTGLVRDLPGKRLPDGAVRYFNYSFPADLDPAALDEPPDALIHCAFVRDAATTSGDTRNIEAAEFLLRLCRKPGGPGFVFISSMSAHEQAESRYGREKLAIEKLLRAGPGLSIRPGFILGPGGVFLQLAKSLQRLPAIPLFYGGRQPIHTVHVDDVCAAVETAIAKRLGGLLKVGEPEAVAVDEFYRAVVESLGLRKLSVRLPGRFALAFLRTTERLGLRWPISSENLLGLK
ncbi:MAG: NAD-dependent epimerase/dehydratase family protein, partial [Bryobacteraceae bacterium]